MIRKNLGLVLALAAFPAFGGTVRIMLPEQLETPLRREAAIDRAKWIWHPTADGWTNRFLACENRRELAAFPTGWSTNAFLRFRNAFTLTVPRKIRFHVSADERFVLTLDGEIVSRGPHRSCVRHWCYQSYEAELAAGAHSFEAVVWRVGPSAPCSQLSWQGGFIFAAESGDAALDAALTTGEHGNGWRVSSLVHPVCHCRAEGFTFCGGRLSFDTGSPLLKPYPDERFVEPVTIASGARNSGYGFTQPGWKLEPSPLPDQVSSFRAPARVCAIATDVPSVRDHFVSKAEADDPRIGAWNDFLSGRTTTLTVSPRQSIVLYCDMGTYVTGFPIVETGGMASGRINLGLQERGHWPKPAKGEPAKPHPNRNACVGLRMPGTSGWATYALEPNARYTSFWWGAGKWLVVELRTGDAPLVLTRLGVEENRYPLENEVAFACDDPSYADIRSICTRTMQMCAHETLMDCPGYEQQMYPGDTRVQLLTLSAMTRDDRMIRRAITLFDWSRDDDGLVRMNYPCWMEQNSSSYTLCWVLMLGDYVRWHDNREWLRQRLPGLRQTMSAFEVREGEDGLLKPMPYWNFMDWAGSHTDGDCDGDGKGLPALMDLFYILALDAAADVERAFGNDEMARHWSRKADVARKAVVPKYWCESRGLLCGVACDGKAAVRGDVWTEHVQVLGILADVFDAEKTARVMKRIEADDPNPARDGWRFARASVYFNHYAFEAFRKLGRADLIQRRFALWRSYVAEGLATCVESPGRNARSDCHAWGAHPLYQMQSAFAGVTPAAPFFERVRIAPQPGKLRRIRARVPHPRGWIETDLAFDGKGGVTGTVTLPEGVAGTFEWQGKVMTVGAGRTVLNCP